MTWFSLCVVENLDITLMIAINLTGLLYNVAFSVFVFEGFTSPDIAADSASRSSA